MSEQLQPRPHQEESPTHRAQRARRGEAIHFPGAVSHLLPEGGQHTLAEGHDAQPETDDASPKVSRTANYLSERIHEAQNDEAA